MILLRTVVSKVFLIEVNGSTVEKIFVVTPVLLSLNVLKRLIVRRTEVERVEVLGWTEGKGVVGVILGSPGSRTR